MLPTGNDSKPKTRLFPTIYLVDTLALPNTNTISEDIICLDLETAASCLENIIEWARVQSTQPIDVPIVLLYSNGELLERDLDRLSEVYILPHMRPSSYDRSAPTAQRTQFLQDYLWRDSPVIPTPVFEPTQPIAAHHVQYEPLPAGRMPETYRLLTQEYFEPAEKEEPKK